MAYCAKCGEKNEDDAKFCSKCGASLTGSKKDYEKEWEDRCEEDCAGGKRGKPPILWGIIVILVGLWIIFGLIIPETGLANNLPDWLVTVQWWWLIGLIIAIAFIITGIRIIARK